jgi:hypothetical protein
MLVHTPAFLEKLYGIELFVPLGCGIKVGHHWNDPIKRDSIPEQVAGFETNAKDGGAELAFDMHRRAQ